MVTEGNLMSQLIRNRVTKRDPVSRVLYKRFKKVASCGCRWFFYYLLLQIILSLFILQVTTTTPLGEVSRMLDREHFVLVVSAQRCCMSLTIFIFWGLFFCCCSFQGFFLLIC